MEVIFSAVSVNWNDAAIMSAIIATAWRLSSRITSLEITMKDHAKHCDSDRTTMQGQIESNTEKISEHDIAITEIKTKIE